MLPPKSPLKINKANSNEEHSKTRYHPAFTTRFWIQLPCLWHVSSELPRAAKNLLNTCLYCLQAYLYKCICCLGYRCELPVSCLRRPQISYKHASIGHSLQLTCAPSQNTEYFELFLCSLILCSCSYCITSSSIC